MCTHENSECAIIITIYTMLYRNLNVINKSPKAIPLKKSNVLIVCNLIRCLVFWGDLYIESELAFFLLCVHIQYLHCRNLQVVIWIVGKIKKSLFRVVFSDRYYFVARLEL